MSRTTHKYPIGYQYGNYTIIDIVQYRYGTKNRTYSKYVVQCLKCGEKIERNSTEIGKDLKCPGCIRNMEYYRYNVGEVINGLEILEKQRQIRTNGKTQRAYLCKCIVDGYVSIHTEDNLLKGKGCPVCAGMVIMRGVNDINTVAPWLGDLLENKEDGYQYGTNSHTKLRFKCPYCGTLTHPIAVYNVYIAKHITCRKCGDHISMPEKIMYGLLGQLEVDFEYQKTFDWSGRKIYDFYIKDKNMIIETHGLQHYRENLSLNWGKPEDIQRNDLMKKVNAINNGIDYYIEIDCSRADPLSLIKTYKNSLSTYFDLSNVDFDKIVIESAKSFCIRVGDLWNCGNHDISSIAHTLHLTNKIVKKHLKLLMEIGYLNANYTT